MFKVQYQRHPYRNTAGYMQTQDCFFFKMCLRLAIVIRVDLWTADVFCLRRVTPFLSLLKLQ